MICRVETYKMECDGCHTSRLVYDECSWRVNVEVLRANGWNRIKLMNDMGRIDDFSPVFDYCPNCEDRAEYVRECNAKIRKEKTE